MKTSKVTSKKQITLPDVVMDALKLKPSEQVTFVISDGNPATVRIRRVPTLDELMGSLVPKRKVKYTDKMADNEIGDYIADDYLGKIDHARE